MQLLAMSWPRVAIVPIGVSQDDMLNNLFHTHYKSSFMDVRIYIHQKQSLTKQIQIQLLLRI